MLPRDLYDRVQSACADPGGDPKTLTDLCHAHPEHAREIQRATLELTLAGARGSELEGALMACLESDGPRRDALIAEFGRRNPAQLAVLKERLDLLDRLEAAAPAAQPDRLPDRIGPYRILSCLGEGGMGAVYLAEQKEPVRRRVALKVIKLGMDSRQVLRRFEAERQALAVMDHSCIARVLEGGMTEQGRPYFAMEYVRGEPLTAYCARRRLLLDQRLELFRQVCAGVQHAHMKGVIHRDLKPSNILVAEEEGRPAPKIIDFGLARATEHQVLAQTVYTEFGQLLGTPEYMAPEQADPHNLDIDIRADVYALGVILFELLAGTLPFPSDELRRNGLAEIQRIIREKDPPRPSSRLGTAEDFGPAASHRTALLQALRTDLDWIVLRALEKDPADRYQSAQDLADDVSRYLADEEVVARPPSLFYRTRKILRRHRGRVAIALVGVLLLFGWLTTSSILYVQAETAKREAELRAQEANQVADFLGNLFEQASPMGGLGCDVSAALVLDQGARRIERELAGQPAVRARLMLQLGLALRSLGKQEKAIGMFERVVGLEDMLSEDQDDLLLRAQLNLCASLISAGRPAVARELLDNARARIVDRFGEDSRLMGNVWSTECEYWSGLARYPEAIEAGRKGVALLRRMDPGGLWLVAGMNILGVCLQNARQTPAALQLFEEELDILRSVLPSGNQTTVACMMNIAACERSLKRFDVASTHMDSAFAMAQRILGPDHPTLGLMMRQRADFHRAQNDHAAAARALQQALQHHERVLPAVHPELAFTLNDLGSTWNALRKFDDARPVLRRAVKMYKELYPSGHKHTAVAAFNLGFAAAGAGDLRAAADSYRDAVAQYDLLDPAGHPDSRVSRGYLGYTLIQLEEHAAALAVYEDLLALDARCGVAKSESWNLIYRGNLGNLLAWTGASKRGLETLEEVIALRAKHAPAPDLHLCRYRVNAAAAAVELDRLAQAREHARVAHEILRTLQSRNVQVTREALSLDVVEGVLAFRGGDAGGAERQLRRAHAGLVELLGPAAWAPTCCAEKLLEVLRARDPEAAKALEASLRRGTTQKGK